MLILFQIDLINHQFNYYIISERIIQVLGASKAVELYKETQRIEAEGGMLVMVSI